MTSPRSFCIYAVSDMTGRLAYTLAVAASRQFPKTNVEIVRQIRVDTAEKIRHILAEAKERDAVLVFTMVSKELSQCLLNEAQKIGVVAMDVMGPVLGTLANYFHTLPSDEPGLQYKVTQDYYKRIDTIDFAVRHDEGLHIEEIDQADIVLLGISRTSKTPLAIYLAYQGYRCANVPVVMGRPLPEQVYKMDRKKLVGLLPSMERLASMRMNRLKKLGRSESEQYAQTDHIEKEYEYARKIFSEELKGICVVEMTGKAIEEIATEILHETAIII